VDCICQSLALILVIALATQERELAGGVLSAFSDLESLPVVFPFFVLNMANPKKVKKANSAIRKI